MPKATPNLPSRPGQNRPPGAVHESASTRPASAGRSWPCPPDRWAPRSPGWRPPPCRPVTADLPAHDHDGGPGRGPLQGITSITSMEEISSLSARGSRNWPSTVTFFMRRAKKPSSQVAEPGHEEQALPPPGMPGRLLQVEQKDQHRDGAQCAPG